MWAVLLPAWDGVFLGVTFEPSYRWLTIQSRRLARMSDRCMLVDICMSMDGVLVMGRPEVEPVNMPGSTQCLKLIDEAVVGLPRICYVSSRGS